jgi:hypothetical protein
MAQTLPHLQIALDFGGSGTKVVAGLKGKQSIQFFMPPHCTEITAADCIGDDFDENSVWVSSQATCYALGILATQHTGRSIKVKPLKVEAAPLKTLGAIAVATQKLGVGKKFLLSVSIVLPSGESQQSTIYEQVLRESIAGKVNTPWGQFQTKLHLVTIDIEGKGILLYHRQLSKEIKNTLVLMLGYRNASFIATAGKIIAAKHCSDIGFHSLLQKIVSLTAGYSIERLLIPVSQYRTQQQESALERVLRFGLDSPHRAQELASLKAAIEQAEDFYINQLLNWLTEFLTIDVDEIVLAGGAAGYIVFKLSEKLVGSLVPHEKQIHWYEGADLPLAIAQIENGDRFLDIYGIWQQVSLI